MCLGSFPGNHGPERTREKEEGREREREREGGGGLGGWVKNGRGVERGGGTWRRVKGVEDDIKGEVRKSANSLSQQLLLVIHSGKNMDSQSNRHFQRSV